PAALQAWAEAGADAALIGLETVGEQEGFCRKVRFLGQNPKFGCLKFNDLQTAKLSKKQLCDRTGYRTRTPRVSGKNYTAQMYSMQVFFCSGSLSICDSNSRTTLPI